MKKNDPFLLLFRIGTQLYALEGVTLTRVFLEEVVVYDKDIVFTKNSMSISLPFFLKSVFKQIKSAWQAEKQLFRY